MTRHIHSSTRRISVMSWTTAVLAAAVFFTVAFAPARAATDGVAFPYDIDQFRDVASAQSLLDGNGFADPFYVGERIWYNPLVSAILAAVSTIARVDVASALVHGGLYLNALSPIAFFVAAGVLRGPGVALLALTWYLFSPAYDEPWATPAYSPWLFPANFAAGFLYVGLIVCWTAARRGGRWWWIAAGAALGVTFLAHTAPAVILGVCALVAIVTGHEASTAGKHDRLMAFVCLAGTALVISAPFVWTHLVRYQLHIVNDTPMTWPWADIDAKHVGDVLWRLVTPWSVLPLIGGLTLLRQARTVLSARLVLAWLATATAVFVYSWLQQRFPSAGLLTLVPHYHFFFYMTAASDLLTGVAIYALLEAVVQTMLARWRPGRYRPAIPATLAVLASAGFAIAFYPQYLERPDFHEYRRDALTTTETFRTSDVLRRIRAATSPDAVILATAEDSIFRVAPAGRHVVAVPEVFSNLYVPFHPREDAQDRMLAALSAGDAPTFQSLARTYGVTHVLLGPASSRDPHPKLPGLLRLLSAQGGYSLYALTAGETRHQEP